MSFIPLLTSVIIAATLPLSVVVAQDDSAAPVVGRVITFDEESIEVDEFVLDEHDTLLITRDCWIKAEGAIVLRGTVRVELPEDAPAAAWAPWLRMTAGERVVILGPMIFGDGRDGTDPGDMGGVGASLWVRAPIVAVGVPALHMGNGGRGGPGIEGGSGGIFELLGWLLPFHPGGLEIRGGRGGDGGDGDGGTARHPRGHRGGDGGSGGMVIQLGPGMVCRPIEVEGFLKRAIGTAPTLDPFVRGPHRQPPTEVHVVGGRGGDGGDGGTPFEPMVPKASGGRGGNGGGGGYAVGPWGLPGSTVTPEDTPPQGTRWTGGIGSEGGAANGGRGGNGGDAGPGLSHFFFAGLMGGTGGDGGRAVGGKGGDAGLVDPPVRFAEFTGRPGRGGRAMGGGGGNAGRGHSGASGGHAGPSEAGPGGEFPRIE